MTNNKLIKGLESLGYRAAIVPISRLDDLEDELGELGEGEFTTRYIKWRSEGLSEFKPKDLTFEPRSIIIVAKSSPAANLRIETGEKTFDITIPPTYVGAIWHEAELDARLLLGAGGFSCAPADGLPYKLLAVHSGIARYGKNNISYVDEFGSFMDLFTLYTDMPCEADPWRPVEVLDICADCMACVGACPTQAIDQNRAFIDSDRCLCSINEHPEPFPDWLDPKAHHTLVGCMRCQSCCPANADQQDNIVDIGTLSADMVHEILNLKDGEELSKEVISRADEIGMKNYKPEFQRNLRALITVAVNHWNS